MKHFYETVCGMDDEGEGEVKYSNRGYNPMRYAGGNDKVRVGQASDEGRNWGNNDMSETGLTDREKMT